MIGPCFFQFARTKQADLAEQLEIKDEITQHLRDEAESSNQRSRTLELELKQHQADLLDTRARLKERQAETDERGGEDGCPGRQ